MDNQNFKVIIIGGGIGGLCLAQGLKKAGINFSVFERNKDNNSRIEGYRVHISPIGSNALYQSLPVPLWNAFLAGTGDAKKGFGFMTEQMEELVTIDEAMMIGYTKDPAKSQYAAGRKMLRYVLQSGLEKNIVYNKTFERFEQHTDGTVKVFFQDGTTAFGDLLVGADGSNSKVRHQLLPYTKRIETDAVAVGGKTLLNEHTRGWLPYSIISRMNVIMPKDKYFFFNAVFDHKIKDESFSDEIVKIAIDAGLNPDTFFDNKENYILWAFIAHKSEFEKDLRYSNEKLKNTVLEKINSWHPDLKKLVKEANSESLTILPLKAMKPFKNWESSNITLMGDAVHNMPPLNGNGANMALHDAVILCNQLIEVMANKKKLPEALKNYQLKMLKDGFHAVKDSMKYTRQAISNNKFQRYMSRWWFRLCNKYRPIKKMTFGSRWVKDKN